VEEIEMLRRDKAKLQDELEKVERERNRWRREVETMRMKGGGPEGPGSSSSSLRR
jgi:cell division protein FtsB